MLKVKINNKWVEEVETIDRYPEGVWRVIIKDDTELDRVKIQDIEWVEDEEEGFEDEENFCTHGNLTTNDIIDKPNRGVAQCPDCGQIVKVSVKPWQVGDNPVACKFITKKEYLDEPEEIEKIDTEHYYETNWITAEDETREKLNEVIKSVNKLETMNKALKEAIIALATEPRPTANLLKQFLNKLTKEDK